MIDIKNLSVGFDDVSVIENVTFSIKKHATTLIVGQSGSGKSVLVKTIEGLIQPIQGQIFIEGTNIIEQPQKKILEVQKKMAMLFQNSALLDSYNVYQNVALPLFEHRNLSEKKIIQLVKQKLSLVGLHNVMDKMPSELSGGMKKRVALARAIILKPEYIIYDEPTTGLDPVTSSEIIDLILQLKKNLGVTSIIITHDVNCIERTAGRILMLHEKKIYFDGNLNEFQTNDDMEIRKFLRNG